MPELPEVETVVRSLAARVEGRRILGASLTSRFVTHGDFAKTARALRGAKIERMERRGKNILWRLDRGWLHLHLGMTGRLLWEARPGPYTRAVFELDNGTLIFDDIRQFGRVEFYREMPPSVAALGPEPLEIEFDEFALRMRAHKTRLKALLLNQGFVAGVGNIYADEILFAARVHPLAKANRVSRIRARRIYDAMREVLMAAIEMRGSSISDYVDAAGERGNFQTVHQAYGKTGEPCARCGTPIRRIVVTQRGTHYCPSCQRA